MRLRPAALAASLALLPGACEDAAETGRLASAVTIEDDAIPAPLEGMTGDAARGRDVFTGRDSGHCVLCHAVAGLDAEFQGNVGPALTGVADRLTPGQIRLRIADAQKVWPGGVMPSYYRTGGLNQVGERYRGEPALTAREIEDLTAWLSTLTLETDTP